MPCGLTSAQFAKKERKTYFYFYMLKQTPTLSFWGSLFKKYENLKKSK
jgi:aryl carrier-like protein